MSRPRIGGGRPQLSERARELVLETIEAEREVGDPEVATAIELLLAWHDEAAEAS